MGLCGSYIFLGEAIVWSAKVYAFKLEAQVAIAISP
jgi:hypothetical protein